MPTNADSIIMFIISNYFIIIYNDWFKRVWFNWTLYFIRKNVHFNFKTETHIHDYFSQCSNLAIKNFKFSPEETIVNRFLSFDKHMFTNVLPFFFWLYILFVLGVGFFWCISMWKFNIFKQNTVNLMTF